MTAIATLGLIVITVWILFGVSIIGYTQTQAQAAAKTLDPTKSYVFPNGTVILSQAKMKCISDIISSANKVTAAGQGSTTGSLLGNIGANLGISACLKYPQ